MTVGDELAAELAISRQAIEEAIRRGLLSFVKHRNSHCWRFGDSGNASFRRLDGQPFRINGESVKAKAETHGISWHRLIGLDDVLANDYRDVLLIIEGSKDALAALHLADAESRLSEVGLVAGLGAGIRLLPDDVGKFHGRRVRIFGDADPAGQQTVFRVGKQLLLVADEVQIFSLTGLHCDDGSLVKDLFDLSRIDYDDFEANRDLWSITDLESRGERVRVLTEKDEVFSFPFSPPHGSPESHGFPVYPVSNCQDLEKEFAELAKRHVCSAPDTAKKQRWNLLRDVAAVQKRILRKLTPSELMKTFEIWYSNSLPNLDPKKTRDDYFALFFAELGKVRVPTGEGEALQKALAGISTLSLSELPEISDVPESWRWVAALHRQLARQSANGTYFLSCRAAAKACLVLNKDSANAINRALEQLGVLSMVKIGEMRAGGKSSEFRYLLPS
jgi:hypothetical protein